MNLDFRPTTADSTGNASHRFWIGQYPTLPLIEVEIKNQSLCLHTGQVAQSGATSLPVTTNQWHNLQLKIDFTNRTVAGTFFCVDKTHELPSIPFPSEWSGTPNRVVLESTRGANETIAGMEFDNLSVQESAIAPATIEIDSAHKNDDSIHVAKLQEQLQSMVGFDHGFEFQTEGQPPSEPWGPGPNSVVKILCHAQSPFANYFATGGLGIHMPNRGEYDGFGRTLPKLWKESDTQFVYATFDFRCGNKDAGGDGTWRYYIGHGPGPSPAVELFLNGQQFFRRSGDARDAVCDIHVGAMVSSSLDSGPQEQIVSWDHSV